MQAEDARFIKRRVRSGTIDVHPLETALIVNYEVEAVILGEHGQQLLSEKKDCQKIIRLKRLDANTDCSALAKDVCDKCTLIHKSKQAEVEHLIYYLRSRKENAFAESMESPRPYSGCESPSPGGQTTAEGKAAASASFAQLEDYLELLYEDLPDKVRGSALILQLAQDSNNLNELAKRESVLSALSRVLREDWKKSIELSTNIVHTFFCFSIYSTFHPIIRRYKVGSLILEIVKFELERYTKLKGEVEALAKSGGGGSSEAVTGIPISRLPLPRSRSRPQTSAAPLRPHRNTTPSPSPAPPAIDKKRISNIPTPRTVVRPLTTGGNSNVATAAQLQPTPPSTLNAKTPESDDDSAITARKLFALAKKQDRLLKVSLDFLLNMANELSVQDKIRRKKVVRLLVQALDRTTPELLVVVLTFLQKLSIFRENKDEMASLNVIDKLPKLLQMKEPNIESVTLNLLFNLSFDTKLREKMVRVGFIPKLVSLLGNENYREIVLKLLYHLSMDDRVKAMFTYTDCIPKVMRHVLEWDSDHREYLLPISLCINLAHHQRCAEIMVGANGECLQELMVRAFHSTNEFLLKIARNISMHPSTKHFFVCNFKCSLELAIPFQSFVCKINPFTIYELMLKVMRHVLEWDSDHREYLLPISLCINLAHHQRCAEIMVGANGECLQELMVRAFHSTNEFLLKIARNISMHPSTKHFFVDFIGDLAAALTCCQNSDWFGSQKYFLFECIGILGNLTLPDINYCQLLNEYNLIPWIKSNLVTGKAKADIVLEVVIFVGTAAGDEACSSLLCKADILLSLVELLKANQEDDEMVLQIIYVFYQIARHPSTREYLIRETDVPAYLTDLMHDKNEHIRKVCDSCLEIIKESSEDWAERIKMEKFEWHNSHWLSMVDAAEGTENKAMETSDFNDAMPRYNLFQQSLLFQGDSQVSLNTGDDIEIVSNNAHSDDGSRPVSRYESETEDFIESNNNKMKEKELKCGERTKEMVRDALRNLVISEDSNDDPQFFHMDSVID
ncbi:kinesin-associated protein 3 [Nilaparvata lugens]|uniref:kinesin-associated protein 3 n=1 Tax=Nilaparvata lugens TaxID=108931 RepID=UPI00193D39ED|nr:kinesin-associated protein 3 [Nilaparvata lugens]